MKGAPCGGGCAWVLLDPWVPFPPGWLPVTGHELWSHGEVIPLSIGLSFLTRVLGKNLKNPGSEWPKQPAVPNSHGKEALRGGRLWEPWGCRAVGTMKALGGGELWPCEMTPLPLGCPDHCVPLSCQCRRQALVLPALDSPVGALAGILSVWLGPPSPWLRTGRIAAL